MLILGRTDDDKVRSAIIKLSKNWQSRSGIAFFGVTNSWGANILRVLRGETEAHDRAYISGIETFPTMQESSLRTASSLREDFRARCAQWWKRAVRANTSAVFIVPEHDVQVELMLEELIAYNKSDHLILYHPRLVVMKPVVLAGDPILSPTKEAVSSHTNVVSELWISTDLTPSATNLPFALAAQKDAIEILKQLVARRLSARDLIVELQKRRLLDPPSGGWSTMPVASQMGQLNGDDGWRIVNGAEALDHASGGSHWPSRLGETEVERWPTLWCVMHRVSSLLGLALAVPAALLGLVVTGPYQKASNLLRSSVVAYCLGMVLAGLACTYSPWDISPFWVPLCAALVPLLVLFLDVICEKFCPWMPAQRLKNISVRFVFGSRPPKDGE